MIDQITKGMIYTSPANVRAQCVEIMFANIYSDNDWTFDHWRVLMAGYLSPAPPVDTSFPIVPVLRIKLTAAAREEFMASEEGSWEDAGGRDKGEATLDEDIPAPHAYVILSRHKRWIEVRTVAEARVVYRAACSGTFGLHEKNFNRTANRIADACRPFVDAADVKLWPNSNGY